MKDKISEALQDVEGELRAAMEQHVPFNSAHEGYAVLLEEMDELWDEVKKSPRKRDYAAMHAEAIQVAAMALRLMVEITAPMREKV